MFGIKMEDKTSLFIFRHSIDHRNQPDIHTKVRKIARLTFVKFVTSLPKMIARPKKAATLGVLFFCARGPAVLLHRHFL